MGAAFKEVATREGDTGKGKDAVNTLVCLDGCCLIS
jgi:hypothetical protein